MSTGFDVLAFAAALKRIEQLESQQDRLMEICEKAKTAFHTLVDIDVLPSPEYDAESLKLAQELHTVMHEIKEEENG